MIKCIHWVQLILLLFNTIPNIDVTNNKFYIHNVVITSPEGSYEIDDIEKFILKKSQMKSNTVNDVDEVLNSMKANHNTLWINSKSNNTLNEIIQWFFCLDS